MFLTPTKAECCDGNPEGAPSCTSRNMLKGRTTHMKASTQSDAVVHLQPSSALLQKSVTYALVLSLS